MSYNPPSGSCLHDVCRQLPSAFGWELVEYGRLRAIGARYGDHYAKYVWLVAVDPAERISADGDKVRRIADNVVVVFPPYTID